MEFYKVSDIYKLCVESGFNFARLEDANNTTLLPFNNKTTATPEGLKKQFERFEVRINSKVTPDGIYFIRCQGNLFNRKPGESFAVKKGIVKEIPVVKETDKKDTKEQPVERMNYDEAIKLVAENAELKAINNYLKVENEQLNKDVEELQRLLDESDKALDEAPPAKDGVTTFLETNGSALLSILDRTLGLAEKRTDAKIEAQKTRVKKTFVIGSAEHLEYFDKAIKLQRYDIINAHLDKILTVNPQLFQELVKKYELELEEEEGEEEENEDELLDDEQ